VEQVGDKIQFVQQNDKSPDMTYNKKITPVSPSRLRSITRLVIGAVVLGSDTLFNRLSDLEKSLSETTIYDQDDVSNQIIDGEMVEESNISTEYHHPQLRHALIGFIFNAQERIRTGSNMLGRGINLIGKTSAPIINPIKDHQIFTPLRRRYKRLVTRGEAEVSRWIEIGRVEETYSRKLVQTALDDTVDMSLEYMAENQDVQELIQTQGTGLAFELIEEVRERSVSGDTYLEGVIRLLLRRPPRSDLPEPPNKVKSSALSLRTTRTTQDQKNIGTRTS
jgi:hypothetical protein